MSTFKRKIRRLGELISRRDFRAIANAMSLMMMSFLVNSALTRKILRLKAKNKRSSLQATNRDPHPTPKVSVIVPNYNHAPFLVKRLNSIYDQTYKNIEVILLDDCSTDNSREILSAYQAKYPDITRTYFNEINSGSLNKQWAKGLSLCSGSLVWIAESDDYCDLDFLEKLVPLFADESVLLSYCRTVFVDNDEKQIWTIEDYLSDLGRTRWRQPYVNSAAEEAEHYFSRKNLIANASSALFRNPVSLSLLHDQDWLTMRICTDWIFYLYLMRGGSIAYTPTVNNYYRRHQSNNSVSTYAKDFYYKEHQLVGQALVRLYNVSDRAITGLYNKAKSDWITNCPTRSLNEFDLLFDKVGPALKRDEYKPNIAICGYAFASGGGETLPIRLANSLKRRGHSVLFINFELADRNDGVRSMLANDIPVVTLGGSNFFKKVREFEAIVEFFKLGVINSHHAQVDQLVSLASNKNFKHFVTMHGMYELMSDEVFKKNIAQLRRSVSAWVYVAKKNLSPFDRFGYLKEFVFCPIPNGIELRDVSPANRDELGIPGSAFVLCLASRAIKEKGWQEAIEAVNQARRESGRDIRLLLVGDGPVYEQVRAGSPGFVHCLGFRSDIPSWFAASDVGILPTYFSGESYPLVILECLIAGKPFIASNVGDIRQMLATADGEMAGAVFDLVDGQVPIDTLASIIKDFALGPDLCARKTTVAQSISAKFDVNLMAEKYESLFLS